MIFIPRGRCCVHLFKNCLLAQILVYRLVNRLYAKGTERHVSILQIDLVTVENLLRQGVLHVGAWASLKPRVSFLAVISYHKQLIVNQLGKR